MARYLGPVCKICRREGQKLFLKVIVVTATSALSIVVHTHQDSTDNPVRSCLSTPFT
jgi:hypothetical protein